MIKINKKVTALLVAEYFINKANEDNKLLTNKKLQKLLYYSQAWFLVLKGKKLFNEKIEAWVHGPAIKKLYIEYKEFGFNPIKKDINVSAFNNLDLEKRKFLDNIWSVYGSLDADYLEMLTHSEDPWRTAREGLQSFESSENEITADSMKSFYTQKLEKVKSL